MSVSTAFVCLRSAAVTVLRTADIGVKCQLTHAVAAAWLEGKLPLCNGEVEVPLQPSRPHAVDASSLANAGKVKTGRGRKFLLHSIAHAES